MNEALERLEAQLINELTLEAIRGGFGLDAARRRAAMEIEHIKSQNRKDVEAYDQWLRLK